MDTRKTRMAVAVICTAILMTIFIHERGRTSARPAGHEVELAGGATAVGRILALRPATYLLQGPDQCLVLTEDEMRKIDGKPVPASGIETEDRVPLVFESFETIDAAGRGESRNAFRMRNTGKSALTELNWGLARHEIGALDHYRVIDEFGNDLPLRVEDDPKIDGKRVYAGLVRPVLPGDEIRVTIVQEESAAVRAGEEWVYRNEGDYPDSRLATRSVLLPAGARVVSVTPEPVYRASRDGRELIVWRRLFVKSERAPWEIRYRM
jgi:hypothetical protein